LREKGRDLNGGRGVEAVGLIERGGGGNLVEEGRRKRKERNKRLNKIIFYYYKIDPIFDQLRTVPKNYRKYKILS